MSTKKKAEIINLEDLNKVDVTKFEKLPKGLQSSSTPPSPPQKSVEIIEKPERHGVVTYVSHFNKVGTVLPSYYIIEDLTTKVTYIVTGAGYEEELCLEAQVLFRHTGQRNGKPQGEVTQIISRPAWSKEISDLSLFCEGPLHVAYTAADLYAKYRGQVDILSALEEDGLTLKGKVYHKGADMFIFEVADKK